MSEHSKDPYAAAGVDYDALDQFKRMAQAGARDTSRQLGRLGLGSVEDSRGESAYLVETPDEYWAHVEEGLGTKNLVADIMYRYTGHSFYDAIAQDAVAMILNDLATCGAEAVTCAMHLAVGSSAWFKDLRRASDLVEGWKRACIEAGCTWGGGETPTLKPIVREDAVVLAGSALGRIKPKSRRILGNVQGGDHIWLLPGSGIHANGLTLAREAAPRLPDGYLTQLSDGRSYGESLLDPTPLYGRFVQDALDAGVDIRYAVNITGHGWRKLMRLNENFSYVIEKIPRPQPVFAALQQYGRADGTPLTDKEMYGTFNMGAGFALIVSPQSCGKMLDVPGLKLHAGRVYMASSKEVVILPKNVQFYGDEMRLR